jgi:hypothetical protein
MGNVSRMRGAYVYTETPNYNATPNTEYYSVKREVWECVCVWGKEGARWWAGGAG